MHHHPTMSDQLSVIDAISHEILRQLLEWAEQTEIQIRKMDTTLTISQILDAFDSEFLLGQLLGPQIEVSLDNRRACYRISNDSPEHSLALACAEMLLRSDDERSRLIKCQLLNLN